MPTIRSLKILRTLQTHPWAYRSEELDALFRTASAALEPCYASVELYDNPSRVAMRTHLRAEVEQRGTETYSFMRLYRSTQRGYELPIGCVCGKSQFGKKEAELALLQFSGVGGKKPVRAYLCPTSSWWHLTSALRRTRPED